MGQAVPARASGAASGVVGIPARILPVRARRGVAARLAAALAAAVEVLVAVQRAVAGIARVGLEGEGGGILSRAPARSAGAAVGRGGLAAAGAATTELLVAIEGAVAGVGGIGLEGGGEIVEALPAPPAPVALHLGGGFAAALAATAEVVVGGAGPMAGVARVGLEGEGDRVEPGAPARPALALEAGDRSSTARAATPQLDVADGQPVARIGRVVAKGARKVCGATALEWCGHGATSLTMGFLTPQ